MSRVLNLIRVIGLWGFGNFGAYRVSTVSRCFEAYVVDSVLRL